MLGEVCGSGSLFGFRILILIVVLADRSYCNLRFAGPELLYLSCWRPGVIVICVLAARKYCNFRFGGPELE